MLPVCSTTGITSSSLSVCLYGGCRHFSSYRKACFIRCLMEERAGLGFSSDVHCQGVSLKSQAATYFSSTSVKRDDLLSSMTFTNSFVDENSILSEPARLQTFVTTDFIPNELTSTSGSLDMDVESVSDSTTNINEVLGGFDEFLSSSTSKGEVALRKWLEIINSSIESAFASVNEASDNAIGNLKYAISNTLTGLSYNSKDASSRAGIVAIDALRHAIVAFKDSLTQGASFVVYAYGSTKELLPPEIHNFLNSSEGTAETIFTPVGTVFQQVYIAVEGLERSFGFDPSDPIVPFVLILGISATLWVSYWTLTYAGYAGDLPPNLTWELLNGEENAVLIDVRPEDFRQRDGIPDLRRAARFRYASVTFPEVNGSLKKLLKSGRDLDDTLIAAVIRNLKIVKDSSKVVVLDADGTRSKGIARSLRKLGIKSPYLVQGGFLSWVQQGLRIKELKPETALTILNEEAEAILEDIRPSPLKVLGYGAGLIAAAYAVLEWEKTLQLLAILGLGQTIYRRVSSYEGAQDFNEDVRLLLAPLKMGGEAIAWAAGKLETNLNGLPTSPSSSDVQNRVLQAAAKHEAQPSEEASQDSSLDSVVAMDQNADLSEA